MANLVEILSAEKSEKPNILAFINVRFPLNADGSKKQILNGVIIFQKGQNRWVSPPSRVWEKNGETKHIPNVQFEPESFWRSLSGQIKESFDEYLSKNPTLEPEPFISADDEIPF